MSGSRLTQVKPGLEARDHQALGSHLTLVKTALMALVLFLTLVPGALGAVEDLTTWTETDGAGIYTVNSTHNVITDVEPVDDLSWVIKDMGANNIGDFNISFAIYVQSINSNLAPASKYAIFEAGKTLGDVRDTADQVYITLRADGTSSTYDFNIVSEISTAPDAVVSTNALNVGQWYYVYVNKTGATFGAYAFSDEAMTTLVASGSVTDSANQTHRYWYFGNALDFNSGAGQKSTLYTKNLNLNADPPGQTNEAPTMTPTGPATNSRFYHQEDVAFTWSYSDPESDPQAYFQIQVDDNSDFSSPTYDSTKTAGAGTSHTMTADLAYGTYYWRGYVWDDEGQKSSATASRTLYVDHRLEVRYHNESGPISGLAVEVTQSVSGQRFSGTTNSSGWIRSLATTGENTTILTSLVNASFTISEDFILVLNPGLVGSGPAGPAPGAYALYQLYNVSLVQLPVGTNTSGSRGSLHEVDGTDWVITEVTGVPGFDIRLNFTGLPQNLTALNIFTYGYYDGNPAHTVHYHVFDHTLLSWVLLDVMVDGSADMWFNISLSADPGDYINDDGELWLEVLHETSGSAGHTLNLDYVQLRGVIPVLSAGSSVTLEVTDWAILILVAVTGLLCAWWWLWDGPLESGAVAFVALLALMWTWFLNAPVALRPASYIFLLLAVFVLIQVLLEAWSLRERL